ncbi:MAG: hypothetical protein ACRD9L_19365 [Bryobacteraceae bacterium]
MTEQEALAQVLREPEQDGPRWQYASLMDSTGDARGEFIRLQIAEAQAESPSARTIHGFRANMLLRSRGAEWAARVTPLVLDYRFQRGFVAAVKMPARGFLEHATTLFALAPIRHLDLSEVRECAGELFASPHLLKIRSLGMDQCQLDDGDMMQFANSPNVRELRWLSVALNRIGFAGAEWLAISPNLPKLLYVNFRGNTVDPGQQFSHDQGYVVDSWLPQEGRELEARHGVLPWLHCEARTLAEVPPDRFALARE